MRYFYDTRIGEIVSEDMIDLKFMAPETYYEYCDSKSEDIIIEVWAVDEHRRINVSYSKNDSGEYRNNLRRCIFEENNVKPLFLTRYEVPTEWFEQTLKDFGLM